MNGLGCACGNPCDHRPGMRGFGQGIVLDRTTDPWDTSQWTITEWAAAAGLVLSVVWVWNLTMKGK